MKRLFGVAALAAVLVAAAAAQDSKAAPDTGYARTSAEYQAQADKMKAEMEQLVVTAKVLSSRGGVMGSVVKGAPYSATEVNETTQVLADGTRIHNETQVAVSRDSEGRVRREMPDGVSIFDPVAGASYSLDPKAQTARKLPLGTTAFTVTRNTGGATGAVTSTYSYQVGTASREEAAVKEARDNLMVVQQAMPKDEAASKEARTNLMVAEQALLGQAPSLTMAPRPTVGVATLKRFPFGPSESLGKQVMEGVTAEGTRSTSTLDVGAVGNDRPIQVISERWYSADLQTVMMTRHSDPRTGEEIFKLTNVSRGEPSPMLFQVPAGYQLIEQK